LLKVLPKTLRGIDQGLLTTTERVGTALGLYEEGEFRAGKHIQDIRQLLVERRVPVAGARSKDLV
jgi:hypothetical protein